MKKIKWGVLGYGSIAKRFIRSLQHSENGELVAIASRSQYEILSSQYQEIKVYDNYQSLLLDPEVDVVYIALVHGLHKPYSIAALKAKKAVFTEKPATLTHQDLQEVISVAQQEHRFYGEALKSRYNHALLNLVKDLKAGLLGDISYISASFEDQMGELPINHYTKDINQGGALWDLGSYPLGFIHMFIPEKVKQMSSTMFLKNGIDTSTQATLTYHEHLQAHLRVSTTQTQSRYAIIRGEKGIVYMNHSNRPTSYTVVTEKGNLTYEFPFEADDMYTQIEEVHRCLNENLLETPLYTHQEMLRTLEVMDEIRKIAIRIDLD